MAVNPVRGPVVDDDVALARPFINAGVPVDGAAGTFAGYAPKGAMLIDTTNGKLYINGGAGTKAVPVWKLVTSAA